MRDLGFILQLLSVLLGVGGAIGGFAMIMNSQRDLVSGLAIIVSSVTTGVLLAGIGAAFIRIDDIAVDARRSLLANERTAKALEALAQSRVGATTPVPFDAESEVEALLTEVPPEPRNRTVLRELNTPKSDA